MIASVEGILVARKENRVVLEVGGLGLEINVPERIPPTPTQTGEKFRLYTYLHVREDSLSLFGFEREVEREIFLLLLGVSGIGPKVALNIVSAGEPAELARLIHNEDKGPLLAFPGIGRKTAERIILELKDKIDLTSFQIEPSRLDGRMDRELTEEAVAALVSIGLTRASAEKALEQIDPLQLEDSYGVEALVREALRKASR